MAGKVHSPSVALKQKSRDPVEVGTVGRTRWHTLFAEAASDRAMNQDSRRASVTEDAVSQIFLSHSSDNNVDAVALRDWLKTEGWDDVFLDVDPNRGIAAGERWERALHEAASRCEAVLFLVSRAWLKSRWCQNELTLADKLNKRLFGVLIERLKTTDVPADLSKTWQLVDLASGHDHRTFRVTLPITQEEGHAYFSAEGLERLKEGLTKAGLDPRFFEWPPAHELNRPPYRGLRPLESEDAGIFFGRDAPIVEALDQLHGMREAAPPRVLAILGASGAGKSSFLRAGLFARLARRDRDFLPLPIIRPERAAISGETGLLRALEAGLDAAGIGMARTKLETAVDGGAQTLRPVLKDLVDKKTEKTGGDRMPPKPPTLVISIDQGEELFRTEGRTEAEQLLKLLAELLTADEPALAVVIAIRSDSIGLLQDAKPLEGVGKKVFDLGPMPHGCYSEVITGPANRLKGTPRRLDIEPSLETALLRDIEDGGAKDALPLLSFTLERLYLEHRGSAALTLAAYQQLGGIKGSIDAAVKRALDPPVSDPTIPTDRDARLALLRRGLIGRLADIDSETGAPRRRVARLSEIPLECRPLLENLVEQRLLIKDEDAQTGETTIEPAHEALLRQWSLLEGWLAADAGRLAVVEGIKRAARDWIQADRRTPWLTHSAERLLAAEQLSERLDLAATLGPTEREYLAACRRAEDQRQNAEKLRLEAELQAANERQQAAYRLAAIETHTRQQAQIHAAALRKRSRVLSGVVVATAFVAIVAIVAGLIALHLRNQAKEQAMLATAQRLAAEALAMVNGDRAGGDERAVQQLLATDVLSHHRTADALVAAAVKLAWPSKLISVPDVVEGTAAYSPDGLLVASGGSDHQVRIWDADTGAQVKLLNGLTGIVTGVAFSPDGKQVVAAGDNGELRLWDVHNERLIASQTVPHDPRDIAVHYPVAFSSDGTLIASCGPGNDVQLWDGQTLRPKRVLTGHKDHVLSLAFSPTGHVLATGGRDGTVRLWNTDNGNQFELAAPKDQSFEDESFTAVAFSPNGDRLAAGSYTSGIWLWDDVDSGHPLPRELIDHMGSHVRAGMNSTVNTLAFTPDGKTLLSGGGNGAIRWWYWDDTGVGSMQLEPARQGDQVQAVAFRPHSTAGAQFMSCSTAGGLRLWNDLTQAVGVGSHPRSVSAVAFSPDGVHIASGSADGSVRRFDLKTSDVDGDTLRIPNGTRVSWLAYGAGGARLVASGNDGKIYVWDAVTGQPSGAGVIDSNTDSVTAVAYSPTEARIVSADSDNNLQMWNPDTGEPMGRPLTGHKKEPQTVAFSLDGRLIASGGNDATVRLWEVATGTQVGELDGHTDAVYSVAFSPDGRRLVSASFDGTVRIWDVKSHHNIGILFGHSGRVGVVAYSPNGTYIASGGYDDGTVRLWNANTLQPVGSPLTSTSVYVQALAFSADGKEIASAGGDEAQFNVVHLWPFPGDVENGDLQKTLCSKIPANMSKAQWKKVFGDIDYPSPPPCPGLPVPD
jgi:WD40 repeat protein